MPPRKPKPKDLLILMVDVGSNITSFEKVKLCAFNIYKGKLFKEKSLDEIGLIIVGSEESENSESFKHISVALTPGIATWANLKAIDNLEQSSTSGDWLQGLKIACQLLEENSIGQSFAKVGFILISNFESEVDPSLLPTVQKILLQHSVDVICIGLSELTKSLREQHPGSYESLEKLGALSIVELCSIEQTLEETQFASKEVKNSVPWNVEFCIGDLAVPITGYKWVGKDYDPDIWHKVKDKNEHVITTRIYNHKSDPTQAPLEPHELVRGYHYGNTIVPMTEEEKQAMKYESGERGLRLICITKKSNFPFTLLQDDTVYIITASTKSQDNSLLLSLINQLYRDDEVAIVRQVYSKNANPNVQVMYPVVDETEENHRYYFVMAHLPFAQQLNNIKVPDVMEFNRFMNKLSEDSYQAEQHVMNSYVDRMDLTKGAEYAEDIPYLPEVTRDPSVQVRTTFQIQKYLCPDRDMSHADIPSHIRQLYEPSSNIHEIGKELKEQLSLMLNEDKELSKNEDVKEEMD